MHGLNASTLHGVNKMISDSVCPMRFEEVAHGRLHEKFFSRKRNKKLFKIRMIAY